MGGEDEGGRFQHQGVEGRPDLNGLVAGWESPYRTDPIATGPQPVLKPWAEFLPSPAHIPDVIVGGNSPGVAHTARQRPGSRRTRKQPRPSNPSVFLSSCVPTPNPSCRATRSDAPRLNLHGNRRRRSGNAQSRNLSEEPRQRGASSAQKDAAASSTPRFAPAPAHRISRSNEPLMGGLDASACRRKTQ